ncbi:thioesterase domain-containing protein [Streptomyces sp. RB6PN25]|uniref:Thioesterase domain-containing protein n=1 Tax=Streptomyces humicola TaxID=2953240 RepID=A0ABT1Q2W7_9ACTN|nr:thioesterase domain-containing protein [Streptomyces humicola]MCQ4084270.1 thioesterase domain-containing protein [Streptomyces humicola]
MSRPTGYLAVRPNPGASLRLFCFHHAGAGALSFARWTQVFGPEVSVLPVRLPGREARLREPRIRDAALLMRELDEHLGPLLDEPYAFYGHSLGALIAYSYALHHLRRGGRAPQLLAAGACSAPHVGMPMLDGCGPSDDDIIGFLHHTGGMRGELAERPEWLRLTVGIIRDDLALARSLRAGPRLPLPCPVLAVAGRGDEVVPPESVGAWRDYADGGFRMAVIDGDHFFVRGSALPKLLRTELNERLTLART